MATVCASPWAFGAVQPWAWGALIVLSLLILILWAGGCAYRGVLRIIWSPLYWVFLAFLALAVVQYLAGLNADRVATREALLKLISNLVFFFLAGQLLNAQPENGRALTGFGLIVTLLAFSLCTLGLAQMLWGVNSQVIYWRFPVVAASPFGPYVNHNDYAGMMEMLLPISVAYILSQSSNIPLKVVLWFGVILVITSIWISGSRGGTVVLVLEGLLFAGLLLWYRPRGVSPLLLPVLLGVVLIAVGAFSWMVSSGHVGGRAWSVFQSHRSLEATFGDRWRVGLDTLRMARSHPWMGVGVGCFETVFPKYMTFPSDQHWTHAHDDIVEAMAETGLPGTLLILSAIVLFFRMAFRHIEERLRHGWGWIQIGAAVGAVGLFFHSFVDFNLRVPANAAWFVLCVAIATQLRVSPDRPLAWPADRIPRRANDG